MSSLKIVLGILLTCLSSCSQFGNQDSMRRRTKVARTVLDSICNDVLAEKPPGPLQSLTELPERFLKSHNDIRSRYNLPKLKWDAQIAKYAQVWADYLRDNYQCQMHHRSSLNRTDGKRYGENLAWNWYSQPVGVGAFKESPEFGNLGWSQECADYDYDQNSCTAGKMCGHFTQVVWKETKLVGCGVAVCNQGEGKYTGKGRAEVWVCNYDPPGNITMIDLDGTRTKLRPF